jgi:hypothetical protein
MGILIIKEYKFPTSSGSWIKPFIFSNKMPYEMNEKIIQFFAFHRCLLCFFEYRLTTTPHPLFD